MRSVSDWELIQEYARSRSEPAFAELVRRHLAWVYSVALRRVGQPQLAEEVAQSVFVLLARKAGSLRRGTILGGWLFRTTCFVASRALRAEQRQKNREQIASSMNAAATLPEDNEAAWDQLAPHLDQAVAALPEPDRVAILLRFYEKQPLQEVGSRLGISEEAAKKRVSRAVHKLRTYLLKRGVSLGGVVLLTALAQKTVQAAPETLAVGVLKAVSASGAAGTVLPYLARETLAAWRWAKLQLAAGLTVASVALLFLAAILGGSFARHARQQSLAVNQSSRGPLATAADQTARGSSAPGTGGLALASEKTGALTGVVLDDEGRPVAGAQVWGGFGSSPYAQDTTDSSGHFALNKLAHPAFVTVTADGFAADQQAYDPTNVPAPLLFRLSPIAPLTLRLVDESGQGLGGVRLFLQNWWGRAGTLGQLEQRTEPDGRLRWLSPPKGELQLSFGQSGYRFSRTNKLRADGLEHIIVLHPVASVRGSITDTETGALVPDFKFAIGYSQMWIPGDQTPVWDRPSEPGRNGVYCAVIYEEQKPFLRIEAEGYDVLETQLHLTNGVDNVCDLQLTRSSEANSIRGTVLLPDGSPAVGVEVALCTANVGVMLDGTAFESGAFGNINPSQWPDYRRKTDAQGAFSLAPKPGAHTVVAVGPAGLGQVRCFDFSKPLEIRLQPWGRVTGTVRTRDGRWAARKIQWSASGNLTSWMTLFYKSGGFSTRSDETGAFTLEHVPPGDGRAALDDGPGVAAVLSPSLHVNPGETVSTQVGAMGRLVIGRLVAPPGLEIRSWSNQVNIAQLHVEWDSYRMPKELTGNAAERWKLEFEDTEAGRKWFRDQHSYDFKVSPEGSFTIPEVLPGKYRLFIDVGQGYMGSGKDSNPSDPADPRIAFAGMQVTVPDTASDNGSPIDLGAIMLHPAR